MRRLVLEKDAIRKLDMKAWRKRDAEAADGPILIEEPCVVEGPGGRTEFVYLGADIWKSQENIELARAAFLKVGYGTSTRTGGLISRSRIFGFQPRNARMTRNFCTEASLGWEDPVATRWAYDLGQQVNDEYWSRMPDRHKAQAEELRKVQPEWRIPGTVFTSGILNLDNRLRYHTDAGNFRSVRSCMVTFRKDVEGGELVVPEAGIRFALRDRSLIMFDGQSWLHGVAPIVKKSEAAHRMTVVYYALEAMKHCGSHAEELGRARGKEFGRAKA